MKVQRNAESNPYLEIANEMLRLEAAGKLPEGFSIDEASQDTRFVELLDELEPYGAIRVYAAEKQAQNARQAAREELSREAAARSRLPKSTRGNRALAVEEDYENMSPEAFRALENRLRKHA